MLNQSFKIFEAIRNSNLFLKGNWRYLLKMSLLPLLVHLISGTFVQLTKSDASIFEIYLWNLPSVAAFGWFTFIQTRLIFLGETLHNIPADSWYRQNRKHSMQASVIIFILFNMFFTFATSGMMLLAIADQADRVKHSAAGMLTLLIVAALFFGIRYAFLYILAAINFPLKVFIKHLFHPLISVQIIAATTMVLLPVIIVFQILLFMVVPNQEALISGTGLDVSERIMIAAIASLVSLASTSLVNVVLAYAVKQMIFPVNKEV